MRQFILLFTVSIICIGCGGQNANAPVDLSVLEGKKKSLASEVSDLKRDIRKAKARIKQTAEKKLTKSSKSHFYTSFSQEDSAGFTFNSKHVGNIIKGSINSSSLNSGKSPAHISLQSKGKK